MYWTMTPISSMWPSSMIVGEPPGFTSAMLLPATSVVTSAKARASSRQTRAGADSNPEGPGVSSRRLRKAIEDSESMRQYIGGMTMLYILIGLGAGVLAGLFGIGGGLLIVPALLYFARMSAAHGDRDVAGRAAAAGRGTWRVGVSTGPATSTCGRRWSSRSGCSSARFFGAKLAHILTAVQLRRGFAVFLVLVAIRVWTSNPR